MLMESRAELWDRWKTWFCYTCIDNWAAITKRCPLCKSEFQHITCTPVYGTIGATDEDEYSLTSCDDDWYVQEESSTLSFPSYYIDAEVTILRQHSSSPSKQSYSSVPQS
ncbi:uncharacterized protein [Miscanthus floridulus]|uniref:uncharacterized protein n=1 Tax=Miscanthus floridulus TaxID=154761 RepID=UPI0034585ECB